ncbi:MAG: FtsQ-type POTRA domain-containing protein [Elusimicrobia bacterium]|nr:FtsQ-type POTRA domain-containing protein [Elusimicrobiota bacterium]
MKRRRHKVTVRRSHAAYRWRSLAESLAALSRALLFVGSAAALAWGAHRFWTRSRSLSIEAVRVDGDAPPGFAEALEIKAGQPLFGFHRRALEQRLRAAFPALSTIHLQRGWDRTVRVTVVQRTPEARALSDGSWWGIDRTGTLFPLPGEGAGLPVLALPDDPAVRAHALAFLAGLRNTKERWTEGLYKIKMSSDGDAVLYLAGDTPVQWGAPDADAAVLGPKARRLARVLAAPEGAGGFEYIRFVDDRRVAAKPRAAAAPPRRRS